MVLSQVIKNNPSGLINDNKGNSSTTPVNPGVIPEPTPEGVGNSNPSAPQPEIPAAPDINEYNYRVTTTTKQVGPSYNSCKLYGYGYGGYGPGYYGESDANQVSVYYEYFERYLTLYKNQTRENNNLVSFYINKYGKTINTSTSYLEGSYAVENTFKPYADFDNQSDTREITYPDMDLDEYISNYFGNDASILEVQTDAAGVKHYIIKSSYKSYCDPSYDPYLVTDEVVAPVQRTIINIYSVNGKTFSIEQVKKYIDEMKDENLIDITTTEVSRSKVAASQVESQFKLASNITVVKKDYSDTQYTYNPLTRIKNVLTYISGTTGDVLLPVQKDGLNFMWANGHEPNDYVNTTEFYKDRTFFPAGAWGDTLFARYNKSSSYSNQFDYTASLNVGTNNSYSIGAYKLDTNKDDVIAEIMNSRATSKSVVDAELVIDGNVVEAKNIVIATTYVYPSSFAVASYPVSYTNSNTSYYTYYIFEYNNRLYSINYYNYQNPSSIDFKEFNLYSLASEEALNNVKLIAEEMYYIYQSYYGPVSYPTSFPVSYSN